MKEKAFFNWSCGKDSALAFYKALQNDIEISSLFTTISSSGRVSMHDIDVDLLKLQAQSMGVPLRTLVLPTPCTAEGYALKMRESLQEFCEEGISTAIFGDIFLEDLKSYRVSQLEKIGLKAYFPLWKMDSKAIMKEFIDLGFKAIVVCIDSLKLDKSFLGQILDYNFIKALPKNVDICGENGEYHTFVYDGPIFNMPIQFLKSKEVYKGYPINIAENKYHGFWYCNLVAQK